MQAKSIKGKSPEEIQSAVRYAMADGFKTNLAIVFKSVKQDRKAVCETLGNEGIDIIGATSCGEFINGYQDEGLHEVWDVPMAGFFTYGEYGRALDRNQEFHSGACCWVALKEKQ